MKYIKIHKEGKWIFAFTLLLLLVLNVIVYMQFQKPFLAINITLSAFLLIFVMFFFRNPRRVVEIDDPSLIVAPADGTVVVIEPTDEFEYFGDKRIQVSIFMSIFNVHANWYPVAGKVIKTSHHSGRHMAAYLPKSLPRPRRFDFMGFGLLSLGIGALQMLLDRGGEVDWFSATESWIYLFLMVSGFLMFCFHY